MSDPAIGGDDELTDCQQARRRDEQHGEHAVIALAGPDDPRAHGDTACRQRDDCFGQQPEFVPRRGGGTGENVRRLHDTG